MLASSKTHVSRDQDEFSKTLVAATIANPWANSGSGSLCNESPAPSVSFNFAAERICYLLWLIVSIWGRLLAEARTLSHSQNENGEMIECQQQPWFVSNVTSAYSPQEFHFKFVHTDNDFRRLQRWCRSSPMQPEE